MAGTRPPADFSRSKPEIEIVRAGRRFGRIYSDAYSNPIGYGKSPSRFSDPRRRKPASRFGVLYLGETLKVCFLEAVLRDQRDGIGDDLPMELKEIETRRYAEIEVGLDLHLVDLREDHAIRMGVPTDVARSSRQTLARTWSQAFHEHPSAPDGIIYSSRLNGHTNLAIYDRAITKLKPVRIVSLIGAAGLADVLNELRVSLV
jgi:hypothetical protein